jgi:hypothetical protein
VSLHGKKGLGEKDRNSDDVIGFWYTLKNLHPIVKYINYYIVMSCITIVI